MVTTTNVGTQPYQAPQPNFSSATEARARTEQVQPREAPAANTQRADRKAQQSRDDRTRTDEQVAQTRRQDGRRGSLVDINV